MIISQVVYLGDLRTENTHKKSGSTFITDAPVDNRGKGQAFSPTDTVATALANCMLTVMGIKANDMNVDIRGAVAQVTKTMASNPRRISGIQVDLTMPSGLSEKTQKILEHTAQNCPVHHSLHPDMVTEIHFNWEG